MKVRVIVQLKAEVSDPEGKAIQEALATLHSDTIKAVRVGKVFDLELSESDPERARAQIETIAGDVLSNPVIEDFSYEIINGAGA